MAKRGKFERKKEICPNCGELKFLKTHAKYCKPKSSLENGNPNPNNPDEPETESTHNFVSGDDSGLYPNLDETEGFEKFKSTAKKTAHKVLTSAKPISQPNFKDMLKNINKLFDVLDMNEYSLTDDELDTIVPDTYSLLKKYYPDVLIYMNNDFIVLGRLLVNIAHIVKSRIIIYQIKHGVVNAGNPNTEIAKVIESLPPEFKEMMNKIGDAMKSAKEKQNEKIVTIEPPKPGALKLYDHDNISTKESESESPNLDKFREKWEAEKQ